MREENNWLMLTGCGFALIVLGWLTPDARPAFDVLGTLAFGSGVAMVMIAQAGMIRLPTGGERSESEEDEREA